MVGYMNDLSVPGDAVPGQAISLAIDIGWTMALLFGEARDPFSEDRPLLNDRLPTEAQLPTAERIKLQERRTNMLLVRLGALLPANPEVTPETPLLKLPSAEVPLVILLPYGPTRRFSSRLTSRSSNGWHSQAASSALPIN
jgi:hypothetical protein